MLTFLVYADLWGFHMNLYKGCLYLLSCVLFLFCSISYANPIQFTIGQPLPPWQPGYLDIYHLDEGAGNSTFMIFPDGTTLLFDIGDVRTAYLPPRSPLEYSRVHNLHQPAYVWVANFIKTVSPHPTVLNYVVLSHFHFDHFGQWAATEPTFKPGRYKLTGITGLANEIHIQTLIDRSYPNYNFHGDIQGPLQQYLKTTTNQYAHLTALNMQNYQRFVNYQIRVNHLHVERFDVGSHDQIHLLYKQYPTFLVQNIIGDGYVWTGKGQGTYHFILYAQNDQGDQKKENDLSNGFRIDYGNFRYFTGGDMTGRMLTGEDVPTSAEAVAAPVVGRVDVATMNHHGFNDAQSEVWVSTLRPQVWIQQNWAASQTSLPMLLRTTDLHLYNYPRDLFAVAYFKLNDLALPALGGPTQYNAIEHYYKATGGSILVRVAPGGKKFWIVMLSKNSGQPPVVKSVFGPYLSLPK